MTSALVTGAGRGIGKAIAARLVRDGYDVVVADVDRDLVTATAAELGATALVLDVADPDAVRAATASITSLDLLVNNAGIVRPGALAEVTAEQFAAVMGVNVLGPLLLIQALTEALVTAQGSVVNVASMSATAPVPGTGIYSVTKAAVVSLTELAALELGPRGVRVNAVSPGRISTEMTAARQTDPAREKRTAALIPAGRVGLPEDVADVVAFLGSTDARYMTGETLAVDGGLTRATVPFFQAAQGAH
jgi:3-oxoacyl-[acyl-carrier protein] reductase